MLHCFRLTDFTSLTALSRPSKRTLSAPLAISTAPDGASRRIVQSWSGSTHQTRSVFLALFCSSRDQDRGRLSWRSGKAGRRRSNSTSPRLPHLEPRPGHTCIWPQMRPFGPGSPKVGSASIWNDYVEPCGYPLAFREAHRLQSITHHDDSLHSRWLGWSTVQLNVRYEAALPTSTVGAVQRWKTSFRHVVLECPLNLARTTSGGCVD